MFLQISFFISLLSILFGIMFITLLERKILSYTQNRIGPNKIFFHGLFQPVLDGVKLLMKEINLFAFLNKILFLIAPILFLIVMLMLWIVLPPMYFLFSLNFSMIFILMCIGMSIYSTLMSGWSSNSKFSMLGAVRSMAQTVSYEISLAMMFFLFLSILTSVSIFLFLKMKSFLLILILLPQSQIWFLSIIAETNRAPFDFAEGESELVSGFNTEFFSSPFALLFIGEYGFILFFSMLTTFMFSFFWMPTTIFFLFLSISSILFIRSVFPRFRYDKLMFLAWFKFLPVTTIFLFFCGWQFFL